MTPLFLLLACAPSEEDLDSTRGGRVDTFFNEPGTRLENLWYPDVVNVMVELIDSADATLDFAVMGFYQQDVVDAFVRAHDRGVVVRMVGDAGHLYNSGYQTFLDRDIPIVTGNQAHIMHHKFMIVDGRYVFCGTANWTDTDLIHNSNNFAFMDSPAVAADFQAEFEQMWGGAFGHSKVELHNGRSYTLGDTEVEVWFSPNEDSMGRILELVDGAQESVRFTIFAFTKDQVGSAFIRKQEELAELHGDDALWDGLSGSDPRYGVAGVVDKSQMHSNGQYHEVYRLMGAQIPMRLDGNDSSKQPGDYQAGGGRLHSKTMLIDADGENPVVVTGSFNWSSSATVSNDEYLLVFKGGRVAEAYADYFTSLWDNGTYMGYTFVGDAPDGELYNSIEPGDVVINEVMWYGAHSADNEGFDEFIELRNMTDRDLKLDMWQITGVDDFTVGLPPGTTIKAGETFLIVDHVLEAYEDGAPQDEYSAYTWGDMVVNAFNDNRQSRLYIKDGSLELFLMDPRGNVVDTVGDGGGAFAGGLGTDGKVRSMERALVPGDGSDPQNWSAYQGDEGIGAVNPEFASEILASPGATNSNH
ncbi:MAG: phospholipase D-like domain-containing protein [Myxococcota bacterium]|nr:phospholipase D-like domain-containing protein [Myxococcota bacterium]